VIETPAAPRRTGAAFAGAVLYPFLLTRAGLLLVAWFGRQFAPSWTYASPVGATRGWQHVPELTLDVWGRYDTWWYRDLATHGYRPTADLLQQQSNLAFFPLYPALVRALHALLPAARQGYEARYTIAVALSNACALAALWLVFTLVRDRWRDEGLARRVVVYLLLFPAGFFLSCAYSESLYLALAAAALLLGQRGRWWAAGLCAALATLSRSSGILVAPALAVLYLQQDGKEPRSRRDALALLLAPAALAAHGAYLAHLSGDALALFHTQAAWGRTLTSPWATLARPFHPSMGPFELAGVALFLVSGGALLLQRQYALATLALLSLGPILLSGTLMSATRFLAVVFPAFVPLAQLGRSELADRGVMVIFALSQAALFVAWSRFYWVA
jgi:Mannosyltransferase (PIG-V)